MENLFARHIYVKGLDGKNCQSPVICYIQVQSIESVAVTKSTNASKEKTKKHTLTPPWFCCLLKEGAVFLEVFLEERWTVFKFQFEKSVCINVCGIKKRVTMQLKEKEKTKQ